MKSACNVSTSSAYPFDLAGRRGDDTSYNGLYGEMSVGASTEGWALDDRTFKSEAPSPLMTSAIWRLRLQTDEFLFIICVIFVIKSFFSSGMLSMRASSSIEALHSGAPKSSFCFLLEYLFI